MSLENLRQKVDEIDEGIVKLIADRIRLAKEIAKQKEMKGKLFEDSQREQVVLKNTRSVAQKEGIKINNNLGEVVLGFILSQAQYQI